MSRALADLGLTAAREAAELIRERRRAGVTVAATKSSDIDIVTQADRDSEELIRAVLRRHRPDDGFLGEEGAAAGSATEDGTSGVRWVVDPIDGTVNFLYDIPQYSVSIAAEQDGRVVAGVVLNVATGTEYVAADGTALRDGAPMSVRGPAPLGQRLIGTGFNYDTGVRTVQAAAIARFLPHVRDIRRLGSCALDLCHVAEGLLDGYVEEGVMPWDHAAGAFIAACAGARVELTRGAGGRDLIMCAPEHGFRTFRDAVADAGFLARSGE